MLPKYITSTPVHEHSHLALPWKLIGFSLPSAARITGWVRSEGTLKATTSKPQGTSPTRAAQSPIQSALELPGLGHPQNTHPISQVFRDREELQRKKRDFDFTPFWCQGCVAKVTSPKRMPQHLGASRAYLEWFSTQMILFQLSKKGRHSGYSQKWAQPEQETEPGPGLLPQGL